MLKHYVEFLYPGFFMSETSSQVVETRDPASITTSDRCVGFRFYDVEEVTLDGETLAGKPKSYSGWFYVAGKVMTLEDVKREMSSKKILIGNMESNGFARIVSLPNGQAYPLKDEDTVLEFPPERSQADGV